LPQFAATAAPTRNDPGDADTGANNLQNYPSLSLVAVDAVNANIRGTLNSTPNTAFTLEFFSNQTCAVSEGKTPLGTAGIVTNSSGIGQFNLVLPAAIPVDSFVTATATDPAGNTSEISLCRRASAIHSRISGRIADSGGNGLRFVKIRLSGTQTAVTTTANGFYSFNDLPIGDYTVTPESEQYEFNPPSRSYTTLTADKINQNFSATRVRYQVSVSVKSNTNGALHALGGVNVAIGGANQSSLTDNNGRALFYLEPSGKYTVTPSLGNYSFTPQNVSLPNPLTSNMTVEFIAQSPLSGTIVMTDSLGIRTANADGSARTYLPIDGDYADLSRDGSQIAFWNFAMIRMGNYDLSSTGNLTGTSYLQGDRRYLRLSPDKTKLLYSDNRGISLKILNIAQGTITNLPAQPDINNGVHQASWSPDSSKIVYSQRSSTIFTSQIFTINADGTNETALTQAISGAPQFSPDWSPDGSKIAFIKSRSIILMNPDGTNQTQIYSSPDAIYNLRWSPDGSRLAFIKTSNLSSAAGISVINGDGSGLIELPLYAKNFAWGEKYQISTPPGINVPVQSGAVSINFSGVSSAGQTTVTPIPFYSAGTVTGSFQLGEQGAYEIATTANYTPPINICFTLLAFNSESYFNSLALLHNENGVLVDRTTSRNFAARQICGVVNSLSPFALAEQIDASKPQISGLVLDSGGNPLSGVRVFLSGAETKQTETNTDGSFAFVNLTEGANYNVQPKQIGYVFDSYSQDFADLSGEQTVVFTGTANNYSISGRVVNASGAGISGVSVRLDGAALIDATTDADGNYTFTGLPADGSYTVSPFNGGMSFSPSGTMINPLLADIGNVDFTQLVPTAASVSIGGRVITKDGRGIRNAQVSLTLADGTTRTAQTGTFGYYHFDGVEVGQTVVVSVVAKRFQFAQSSQVVSISDAVDNLDFMANEY
jgi:hypothetical protein